MFDADQIIFEAAALQIEHSSVPQRRRILQALLTKINVKHPAWKNVSAQLALLETMRELELELPLKFTPQGKQKSPNGDGE